MAKPDSIHQVNPGTGEISNVLLKLSSRYPQDNMVIMADVHGGAVEAKDIRIFPKTNKIEQEDDLVHVPEEFLSEGMCDLSSSKQFSKIFHSKDPEFSKDTYYKYWYNICRNLGRDTNIVMNRNPTLHFVNDICEFESICGSSKSVTYRFIKECMNRGLLMMAKFAGRKIFIADPNYSLNGNKMPVTLMNLFKKAREEILENE